MRCIKNKYSITPNDDFPLYYQRKVIQHGDSACGVYSLYVGMLLLTPPNELPLSPLIITKQFITDKKLFSYSRKYLKNENETLVANFTFEDNITKLWFLEKYPIKDHIIRLYLFVLFNK